MLSLSSSGKKGEREERREKGRSSLYKQSEGGREKTPISYWEGIGGRGAFLDLTSSTKREREIKTSSSKRERRRL